MMIPVTGKELVINYSEAAVLVLETERGRGRKQLLPACLRSWGVPDLARTSRSTRLRDMRPKVRPDINPANSTSSTITNMCKKNSDPQHEYSTAILSLSLSQTSCCYSERKYKHLSSTVSIVFVWYRERRKKLVEVWCIYIYRYRFIIKMNIIIINFYYLLCYYYYLKFGMGKGKGWSSSRWLRECVVVRWTISWIGFVGESGSWVVVCVQMKTVNGESPNLWILIWRTFRLLTPDKHVAHINHHHNHNHNHI